MMKVGIIAPIKFLRKYCITNIQYCLPSLLEESKGYREFYLERQRMGNIVILDCKKISWRREPEDLELVKKVLTYLKPTYIILPSYMYSVDLTIMVAKEYSGKLKGNFIGCLEGTTLRETKKCAKNLKLAQYAIPSHLFNICKGYFKEGIFIENHSSIDEFIGSDGILVTSLPVRLGLQGRLLSDDKPSPPSLTFHEDEDRYPTVTRRNVEEAIDFYEE